MIEHLQAEFQAHTARQVEAEAAKARLDEFLTAQEAWFNDNDSYFDDRDTILQALSPDTEQGEVKP